jgi:aminoglycoside 6-adenylyltransferase
MLVPQEAVVLERLVAWGEANASIRALILTSSRAGPDGRPDLLSDYDVIVAARDTDAFAATDGWAAAYGRPLVRWGDEDELHGLTTYFRGVVYEDGTRVDYTFWPAALLDRLAEEATLPAGLDADYRVLLDKDGETAGWPPPTHRGHVPEKPTRAEYEARVHEFWWDALHLAKSLWRGDVVLAKFLLDYDLKFVALRPFLEWRVELDHDWGLAPGAHGRGLERLLPADVWSALASTYGGTDGEENWRALFRTIDVFRNVATEVADALGHPYPRDMDAQVTAQLERVRNLPPR